ncbi:MAG TPA: hypothetical protein VGX94_03735 [Terriglobia bacterium]|nr:hypothetical protein [Terriglobia bacterium]
MQPLWRSIVTDFEVSAKPQGIWTKILDYVGPSRKLRLRATGTWTWQEAAPAPSGSPQPVTKPANAIDAVKAAASSAAVSIGHFGQCGPDGDIYVTAPADALLADVLPGALIGKIGGSSAAVKNSGAFVVGSDCVLEVDANTKGPLYLTINDSCVGMHDNSGTIRVSIWEAL